MYLKALSIAACIMMLFICKRSAAQTLTTYDSTLARQLGADEYGMRTYVLAILKTGNAKLNKPARDSLQAGHMKNIVRLAAEGKLAVAGPLESNKMNYRGIYVLNVNTLDEARKLVATDPAIAAHVFDIEMYIWYGSAALVQVPQIHAGIQKTKF